MKTSIDVDRTLATEAAEILGTRTLKETVNTALQEVVRQKLLRDLAQEVRDGTLPVPTEEEYRRLREPKLPVGALDGFRDLIEARRRAARSA
jgi:Arc/MetJ family transcription regulator